MPENQLYLNILIIEDDCEDLAFLKQLIYDTSLQIETIRHASLLSAANEIIANENINLIFLDLLLPDSSGINSFLNMNRKAEKIPIIILSGLTDKQVANDVVVNGAQDYLIKGEFDHKVLSRAIRYSIERKRNLETLKESNERYKNLFNNNPMPMWVYDRKTLIFLEVNEAAIQRYGYSRNEFLQMSIFTIRAPEDSDPVLTAIEPMGKQATARKTVWRHITKGGIDIFVHITTYDITFGGRDAVLVLAEDVSESIRLEKELRVQQQIKQKQITEAVIRAQERERTEIGIELHDNVNQILGACNLYISTAMTEETKRNDLLQRSSSLINDAIQEIRKISQILAAPGIKDIGLVEAVEDLIDNIQMAKNIKVNFTINHFNEDTLDENRKLTIFRIIQEQLKNIIKHAHASEVSIKLAATKKDAVLTIVDNGDGFDTSQSRKGVGITNIISRVELFNGEVDIESRPERGCKLKVRLPC